MDIYDRAGWPPPEQNPILGLLRRPDEWFPNSEVVDAFKDPGMVRNQMPVGPTTEALEMLGSETRLEQRGSKTWRRYYTKKAIVLMAMRARTRNARAFRDWLAERMAGEADHG